MENENYMYDDNLINNHYEEILDIIGQDIKSKKQIKDNKNKIISFLKETYSSITSEKLANGFNMLYSDITDINFKYNNFDELNSIIRKYINYVYNISHLYKDHGYSLLLCGYFWLTKDF